jgi:hypothetical protein
MLTTPYFQTNERREVPHYRVTERLRVLGRRVRSPRLTVHPSAYLSAADQSAGRTRKHHQGTKLKTTNEKRTKKNEKCERESEREAGFIQRTDQEMNARNKERRKGGKRTYRSTQPPPLSIYHKTRINLVFFT